MRKEDEVASPLSSAEQQQLDLDKLRAIRVLGKGAMGTVFLVHDHISDPCARSPFALKAVDKSSAQAKLDADRRARWEISVLTRLTHPTHPFLPTLIGSLESDEFFAWAVPFCPGGDLNVLRHRQNDRVFSPAVIRFYIAEIILALDRLHDMHIVYRDLKPENVLIQQSGHITLTDFDLSRSLTPPTVKSLISAADSHPQPDLRPRRRSHHRRNLARLIAAAASYDPTAKTKKKKKSNIFAGGLKKAKSARVSPVSRRKLSLSSTGERSNSFVGTEEYVSPEVVRGDGHEFAVDWWALGVLTYEMLYGRTPFKGKNRKETFGNILVKTPEFVGEQTALTDLIRRLLEKDPARRLGNNRGASEIKEHPFFNGLRWDLLTEVVRPPFLPSKDDDDSSRFTTGKFAAGGVNVREYFQNLRAPPPSSFPPSPMPSPDRRQNVSLTEF